MFKNIKINNLRGITELEIDNFGQINLFVGQNCCGKTTVLEAIFMLTGATNPALPLTTNSLRGLNFFAREMWKSFFCNCDIRYPITIKGNFHNDDKTLTIRCKKTTQVSKPLSSEEVSKSIRNGTSQPDLVTIGLDLEYTSSNKPSKKVKTTIFESDKGIIPEGIEPSYAEGFFLGPYSQASELKTRFDAIQNNKQLLDEVILLLKCIDPKISDLRLNRAGILIADIGISGYIPVNFLGGGMMKFLDVAFAMLNYQNGIIFIDEIENGLHHSAQEKLWNAIFKWSEKLNVQVFATTHSYECIKAFTRFAENSLFPGKAKLYRIEIEKGSHKSVEFGTNELKRFLENIWEIR
jgi:AAA15 family ATPase/GTPase